MATGPDPTSRTAMRGSPAALEKLNAIKNHCTPETLPQPKKWEYQHNLF